MAIIKPKLSMQFEPDWWNHRDRITSSNCLAYALDEPSLGWPYLNFQSATNSEYNELRSIFMERSNIKSSLYHNILFYLAGFERIRSHQYDPHKKHIIAFSVSMGHYFRLDADKVWSHKPGMSEARNIDDSGNIIYNLENSYFFHQNIDALKKDHALGFLGFRTEYFNRLSNQQRESTTDQIEIDFLQLIQSILCRQPDFYCAPNEDILYFALPSEGIDITPKDLKAKATLEAKLS